MQTIRLIKPYAYHAKGQVLTLAPGIASELIRTGRAEAVVEDLVAESNLDHAIKYGALPKKSKGKKLKK